MDRRIPADPAFGVDLAAVMEEKWDEISGKVGTDWFFAEDAMAYLSYSHGYKGGGFSIGQFDVYDQKIVDSIELGLKSQFWKTAPRSTSPPSTTTTRTCRSTSCCSPCSPPTTPPRRPSRGSRCKAPSSRWTICS